MSEAQQPAQADTSALDDVAAPFLSEAVKAKVKADAVSAALYAQHGGRDLHPAMREAIHAGQMALREREADAKARDSAEASRALSSAPAAGTLYHGEAMAAGILAADSGMPIEAIKPDADEAFRLARALDVPDAVQRGIFKDMRDLADAARRNPEHDATAGAAFVLKGAWGREYEANLARCKAVIDSTPGLGDWLDRTGMGNSPQMANALLSAAKKRGIR